MFCTSVGKPVDWKKTDQRFITVCTKSQINGGNMLNALLLIGSAWAGEWQSLGVTNDVAVYRKQEEGTGLYAFKGEATSELPIGQLMGILRDESVAKEWVNMMMFGTVVETYSENHMLLHQGYDLPWPLSDRDYVFDKKSYTTPIKRSLRYICPLWKVQKFRSAVILYARVESVPFGSSQWLKTAKPKSSSKC